MQLLCMHCIFFILNLNNRIIFKADLQRNKAEQEKQIAKRKSYFT